MNSAHRTVVVSGMIAADPYQGGATWAVLQYLLGLRRLGHDVVFVEPIDRDKIRSEGSSVADSVNHAYLRASLESVSFDGPYALVESGTTETAGMSYAELVQRCSGADLLINVSGMLTDPELIERIAQRVYLDLDPAFVQVWNAQGIDMRFDAHTDFVTVGLDIGSERCTIPTDGRRWITTLQPVVLEQWPYARVEHSGEITTIANWRGYGSVEHEGVMLGQKAHSLREIIDLPKRVGERFTLALSIHPDETRDLALLRDNGWHLVDPADVAGTPDSYRSFIQRSFAEIGVAKSGYVRSHCGWFSDRSICYLASGRPVIAQNTGFAAHVPTGEGLFGFDDIDDVAEACARLRSDYDRQRRSARALAEDLFDSDKVLTRLFESLDNT